MKFFQFINKPKHKVQKENKKTIELKGRLDVKDKKNDSEHQMRNNEDWIYQQFVNKFKFYSYLNIK